MTDQFIAEIRIFAGNFAPTGWAFCNGQLLPISQNTALFSLLGTTYGGDGQSNFALPNLQGKAPLQQGMGPGLAGYALGQTAGSANVTLTQTELPSHTHPIASNDGIGDVDNPVGNVWATAHSGKTPLPLYSANTTNPPAMSPQAVASAGGGLPHNNLPPYLVLNFIIALQGIFPPRP